MSVLPVVLLVVSFPVWLVKTFPVAEQQDTHRLFVRAPDQSSGGFSVGLLGDWIFGGGGGT